MRVLFRTDASTSIGTGHVARCLTLANRLKFGGAKCSFICREHEGNLISYLRQQGFEVAGLPVTDYEADDDSQRDEYRSWLGADWQSDAEMTIAVIGSEPADWIVVDHYGIDQRWERRLRPHCRRLMVIDDLANREHDCDLLLDQNAVADADARYSGKVPVSCQMMLGPRFALLQPQYKELRDKARIRQGQISRLLVYFGGADVTNLTGMAVSALLKTASPELAVDVVVDPSHPHAKELAEIVQGHQGFALHGRIPTLAPLLLAADLAIGAGGTTSWERCCLGLPTLVITLAKNQEPIAEQLDRLGVVRWLGGKTEVSEETLCLALEAVFAEPDLESWSRRALDLVDGLGTERVCEALQLSSDMPLQARRAGPQDEALLLNWANDPVVRRNAFSEETIAADGHHRWYQARLADAGCHIFIVHTTLGLPVGQVRLQKAETDWIIDYSIAAPFRGRGLGAPMLHAAMKAFSDAEGDNPLLASVKATNIASLKVFSSLGFVPLPADKASDVRQFRYGRGR